MPSLFDGLIGGNQTYNIRSRPTLAPWQEQAIQALIAQLQGFGAGNPNFGDARKGFLAARDAGPTDISEFFKTNVEAPALRDFQETVLPGIARQSQNTFFSSDRQRADTAAQRSLIEALTQSRSNLTMQMGEAQKNRSLQASQGLAGLGSAELAPLQLIAALLGGQTRENIAVPTGGGGLFSNFGDLLKSGALAYLAFA